MSFRTPGGGEKSLRCFDEGRGSLAKSFLCFAERGFARIAIGISRFARNDIKGRNTSHGDGDCFVEGGFRSNIVGISRFARNDKLRVLSKRARQGDAVISTQERMRLLRCARNDIKEHTLSHRKGVCALDGALMSGIIGISRSPFHGSLEIINLGYARS